MLFWNTDNKELNKIWFQYSKNKLFYDNHKTFGDQEVILSSNVKYKFFPGNKVRYFKYIKEKEDLDTNISIIVCKGKIQKEHMSNFIIRNYWK